MAWLKKSFERFIGPRLPDRTKRLVLITSVLGCVRQEHQIDNRVLAMLNAQFSLSYNEEALKLPIALYDKVLPVDDMDALGEIGEFDSEEEYTPLAVKISKLIPDWLHYSSTDTTIVGDIRSALYFNHCVHF